MIVVCSEWMMPLAGCRHDGQMGIEDAETTVATGATTVTRYGLGARGVDVIQRTSSTGTVTTGFPVYDAHGNDVATLSRDGGGGYAIADRRTYDAWGVVRSQQSGGDPKLRYCASLGHKQDDETGLVYMRARYYEPTSGRFVSEDPAKRGLNRVVYCENDPINLVDSTGKDALSQQFGFLLIITGLILLGSAAGIPSYIAAYGDVMTGIGAVKIAFEGFVKAIDMMRFANAGAPISWIVQMAAKQTIEWMTSPTIKAALSSLAGRAVLAAIGTGSILLGVMVEMDDD